MAMHGDDRLRRRRSLQERLGLACCGSTWAIGSSTFVDPVEPLPDVIRTLPELNSDPDCVPASPRMNLADALAAERDSRSTADGGEQLTPNSFEPETFTSSVRNTTTTRMSLMRLLEETDDQDEKEGVERDMACCVCMGRKKGAAFIPCGHTFCRVCSRELWLNRGSCPLCNRSILEVLDIF
ncbi:hypothetical protein M8C21_007716 [Ambrosia artemisiifolia]|uniref:RING-type domain-containing protein n=1 Tax=Ambrosia artemisiifolia TaxID=4212 RepID=A0AAD5CTV8_AMBAR|nr:hypothetical protein M8C21_007716 [Ambrosia artemisiifolia]